jgi:hypothetical protein
MGYTLTFEERTSGPNNAIFFDWEHCSFWGGSSNQGDDYGVVWLPRCLRVIAEAQPRCARCRALRTALPSASARNGLGSSGALGATRRTASVSL